MAEGVRPGRRIDPARSARPTRSLALSHATTDGLVGHYLAEEIDAAFLYRELAAVETDDKRRDLFRKLAEVEDRHVERWEQVLAEQGGAVPTDRTADPPGPADGLGGPEARARARSCR